MVASSEKSFSLPSHRRRGLKAVAPARSRSPRPFALPCHTELRTAISINRDTTVLYLSSARPPLVCLLSSAANPSAPVGRAIDRPHQRRPQISFHHLAGLVRGLGGQCHHVWPLASSAATSGRARVFRATTNSSPRKNPRSKGANRAVAFFRAATLRGGVSTVSN